MNRKIKSPIPHKELLRIALNYGSIMAIIGVVGFVLNNAFAGNRALVSVISIGTYVAAAFTVYYGIKKFKVVYGSLSMRDGILLALYIGVISGLIISAYMYLYYYVVSPEAIDKVMEHQREALEKLPQFQNQPNKIEEEIAKFRAGFPYYLLVGPILGQSFIALLAGLTSAFMLKDQEPAR